MDRYVRPIGIALLLGKRFQVVKQAGEAGLKAELQVVLTDHQHQHRHQQREETKGEAHRALATLLRAEIVTHQCVKGLSENDGSKSRNQQETKCLLY